MSDFHQSGLVANLHSLPGGTPPDLEAALLAAQATCPVAVVIPLHASEIGTPALDHIVQELRGSAFPKRVIFSMNGLEPSDWKQAQNKLSGLPMETILLWNDGPPQEEFHRLLAEECEMEMPLPHGKGLNLWMACGWVLARGDCGALVCHDADILSYSRSLVARLSAAVALPQLRYGFAKGYYSRVGGRLYGRVTRLFVTPLLRGCIRVFGHQPLLDYLDDFRYVLAGEFGMRTGLAEQLPFASDWGVEIDLLASVFRTLPTPEICQVAVAENFEHKHRPADSAQAGLLRMAREVAVAVFDNLHEEGARREPAASSALVAAYRKAALEAIQRHKADAWLNGIRYDEAGELDLVNAFSLLLEELLTTPTRPRPSPLPPWRRLLNTKMAGAVLASATSL